MLGLDRGLVEHSLLIRPEFHHFHQPLKRMSRMSKKIELKVKGEIEKLLKAKFIRSARYVQWLENIVPMIKKNGKLRLCVDFKDLKVATPKDMYVMPIADMLVDSTANNELLSFMDGLSGYKWILIAVEDIPKTTFRCPDYIGTFEWLVMPLGLKNAVATYQRAMNTIFHDMLGHHMGIYIDDIVVKSKRVSEHADHLRRSFERMRHHQSKLNKLICAFRVRAGNFLEFLVHQRGIEVGHNKEKAIASANAPQNKKEL